MITELANYASTQIAFIKWVSERNTHIPMSERLLMGHSPFDHDDDE